MAITSNAPITVDAQPAKFYNVWWLTQLSVNSTDPNMATVAFATFSLATVQEDGSIVFYKDSNGAMLTKRLDIPDLFALAAQQREMGTLINSVITTIGDIAKSQGVIN